MPREKLNGSIISKEKYSDFFLHVEFRTPEEKQLNGGVYLQGRYELNIKDTFCQDKGQTCGCFGNVQVPEHPYPSHNWSLPPMVWQTLDIEFTAPRFGKDGKKTANARVSVKFNGETIYTDAEIEKLKGAAGRLGEAVEGPVYL